MPKGGFFRTVESTLAKFVKMPWAVSGRRYAVAPSPSTGPAWVLNIRLKARGSVNSVEPQFGQTPSILSSRQRSLHFLQSTNGSVNVSKWPDAAQMAGGPRIAASKPTMSERIWTIARHQACLTLRSMLTPRGP